jgi:type I restriction enzyme S subunit
MKPGYKQTEVGVIPEEWEVSSVGEEFEIQLGKMLDAEKNVGVSKPYLGNRAVQWDRIDVAELPTVPLSRADIERFRLKKGDLLVCEGGEVGRAAVWEAPIEECYYQKALHRLRPKRGFSVRVMAALLRQWSDRGLLTNYVTQTSIAHLPREKLLEIPLLVPPLPEQRAIAGALSEVDALLGAQEALLAKKRDLKAAAMQQLLTGQTRLPSFTGEWEVKRLGEVAELITKGTTPTSIGQNFTESGVNFLKAESISENGSIISEKTAYIDNATHALLRRSQLKDGDLLISIAGVLGRIGTVSSDVLPANTNQALAIIRLPKNSTESRHYIFYFLRSSLIHKQINDVNVQAAQSNISLQNVGDLQIHLPPPAEQTAIAAVLSDMDAEIAALEAKRDKTRTLKQGMMQELLTGRIRLV